MRLTVSVLDLNNIVLKLEASGLPLTRGANNTDVVSLYTMSIRSVLRRPVGRSNTFLNVFDGQTGGGEEYGGAYRDRTDDLLNANQALSQLS